MSTAEILLPLFVQVLLTLVVMFVLVWRRGIAIRGNNLKGPIALREANWPEDALKAGYNYLNQFELPVLFYVVMILALVTKSADYLLVLLAWIFVISRIVHAYVHLTFNNPRVRGPVFFVGSLAVTVMWIIYIVRILAVS